MIYGFRARYLAVGRWANFCLDADPSASARARYWAVETAATAHTSVKWGQPRLRSPSRQGTVENLRQGSTIPKPSLLPALPSSGTLVPVTATLPGLRMGGFVSRYLSAVASLGLGGESWTQTSIYYVPNVVSYH